MRFREWDQTEGQMLYDAMGMPYPMPDVNSPAFALKEMLEDDKGKVVAAGAVKIIGEVFLWIDPAETKLRRAKAVRALAARAGARGAAVGFEELSAWVPPSVEAEFGTALHKLGWSPSLWRNWSMRT